jgi:hypothetical protein
MADVNADVSDKTDPAIAAAAAAKKDKDDLEALRAENASLKRTNSELSESERFHAGRADAAEKKGKPAPKADDEDDPDDTPEKFVDDLSASGVRALEKRGVLTKKAARELIKEIATEVAESIVGKRAAGMMSDAKLLRDYPDLEKEGSELHKATGVIYRELIANDPALKNSPGTLAMAARLAKAEMKKPDEDEAETKRLERVRAQQGDRGRRTSSQFDDDDAVGLTETQKSIAASFGVDEKEVIAEKKKLRAH